VQRSTAGSFLRNYKACYGTTEKKARSNIKLKRQVKGGNVRIQKGMTLQGRAAENLIHRKGEERRTFVGDGAPKLPWLFQSRSDAPPKRNTSS